MPTPDAVLNLASKHINATLGLINGQLAEASSTLGAPSPPALPAFTMPALPKGMPALPGAAEKKPEATTEEVRGAVRLRKVQA